MAAPAGGEAGGVHGGWVGGAGVGHGWEGHRWGGAGAVVVADAGVRGVEGGGAVVGRCCGRVVS